METVDLAHRSFEGPEEAAVVLLLHGMLGSSRNWQRPGKMLAEDFRVYALDLRNHGDSPHDAKMDYPEMAADVVSWMDKQGIDRVHLVGHSMGGKVSMYLSSHYAGRVSSLTVADIAPRAYPPRWKKEFALMGRMPVQHMERRSEAEEWLSEEIRDWAFRKFLVTNLTRREGGGFAWTINLEILEEALPNLFQQIPKNGERYEGPVQFIRGGKSRFIEDHDEPMIRKFFPKATVCTIADAGHNVHFDKPEEFVAAVRDFIGKAEA